MAPEDDWKTGRREATLGQTPLRRIAQPDDIVGPVTFLASNDSRHITGALLLCDGRPDDGWRVASGEPRQPPRGKAVALHSGRGRILLLSGPCTLPAFLSAGTSDSALN